MSNLITRWDATEVVYKALRTPTPDYKKDPFHDSMSLAIAMVQEIPSAQQWVPVSERLPETSEKVLITRRFGLYVGDDYDRCIDLGYYYSNLNQWDTLNLDDIEVLAWMPLPEPYCGAKMEVEE